MLKERNVSSFSEWDECLKRAIEFGWTPEGTVDNWSDYGEWDGSYYGNEMQIVTDRDARALGEARFFAPSPPFPRDPELERSTRKMKMQLPSG